MGHDATFRLYVEVDEVYNLACLSNTLPAWGNVNPIGARACYDEGKRCAETLVFDYVRQHRLAAKMVRIFNTYALGCTQTTDVWCRTSSRAAERRRNCDHRRRLQTQSFCYVDDLIDAIIRMMATGADETGPINIASPSEVTIRELAEAEIDLTNSRSEIVYRPAPPDDAKRRRPDVRRAAAILGWRPITTLRDGPKKTIVYFEGLLERNALSHAIGAGRA